MARVNEDIYEEVENVKEDYQRRIDINHGLKLEIRAQEKDVSILTDEVKAA